MVETRAANWRFVVSLAVLSFATVLLLGDAVLGDPDTYWHIGAGRWIIAHRAIPTADPFSNSVAGIPWVPHEWLSEVIFAAVYQWLGWSGIILHTALFAGGALGIFGHFVIRWLEPLYALIVVIMGLVLLMPHLYARPHILALPFMIAFVGELVTARERHERPSLWLLPLICTWANLHGAFVIGIGFAAYFTAEALFEDGWEKGKSWLPFLALVICSSLVTPNGVNGLLVLGSYSGLDTIMGQIKEWQPPNFQTLQPVEIWILGFVALGLALGVRLRATRLIIVVGLLHLALKQARNVELLGFLAPLVVLPSAAPQVYAALKRGYNDRWISTPVMAGVALLVLVVTSRFLLIDHERQDDAISPIKAVAAARAQGVTGPVFNSYGFGGYLIFAGIAPFIDGRGEMYGDAFFKRYVEAEEGGGLPELLTERKFGWVLIEPDLEANRVFARLPDWHPIYSDKFAVVYVPDSPG